MKAFESCRGRVKNLRTVVDYDREAFVWQPGNIRVTLDSDIRAGLSPERFLSPGVPELTAAEAVLEVK